MAAGESGHEVVPGELRVLADIRNQSSDIDRYLYLRNLQDENEPLFYAVLINHAQELLEYVYTPTVGEACLRRSELPVRTLGLYITPDDKGKVREKLKEWPQESIRVVVVTDGERILGLGDQGWGGMGISEGKILLYTVIAGVDPKVCLPVCLDVGTDNEKHLKDPKYKGRKHRRLRGQEYDELVKEFVTALREWPSHVLLQFEDFGNENAFQLLEKYSHKQCCFNDDIQGTACITLAGILSGLRVVGKPLTDQRIMFLGAGEAGTGIGQLIALMLVKRHGWKKEDALQICTFVDSHGLVCKERNDLAEHKQPFAHDIPFQKDLISAIKAVKPTVMIGTATIGGAFTKEVCETMASLNEHPIIFPLSNPTSKSECSFQDAYEWTNGKVVFASGSAFPPYKTPEGQTLHPAQCNNAYVFGPLGMAAVLSECREISDEVFLTAAEHLAQLVPEERLDSGMLYPTFKDFHEKDLAAHLTARTAEFMVTYGLGKEPEGFKGNWFEYVKSQMFTAEKAPELAGKERPAKGA